MKQLIFALVLLNLLTVSNYAQGEGALPSLTMQRSLQLIGAGSIGAAKANNDPIGYYLNPAILGYTSQNNHASFFFMPSETEWAPKAINGLTNTTLGFNVGYNFKELGIPVSLGFGYMNDKFSYGNYNVSTTINPNGYSDEEAYDSFSNYSLGIGIDYYLLFNFGMSVKSFDSYLGKSLRTFDNAEIEYRAEGTALDYGAMIITPISKLFFNNSKLDLCHSSFIKPVVNFTLGYSQTNVGDEITYFDVAQSDPLSRTGRLGYTFDFGFDAHLNNNVLNLITYSFTVEAEDLLIKTIEPEPEEFGGRFDGYQSLLGDIDVWENLIQLKSNDEIVLHKGHTFNILETITLTFGNFSGRGYHESQTTMGYGISTEGPLKFWSYTNDNKTLEYVAKHFVVEYYNATLLVGSWVETNMEGISLHMKNIEL